MIYQFTPGNLYQKFARNCSKLRTFARNYGRFVIKISRAPKFNTVQEIHARFQIKKKYEGSNQI
jgi:hypothetical protein